ncbi:MAG: SDR family oxidoreductase [Qingshengfaniella sp.]
MGKINVVTGGARGIGAACAQRFAQGGWRVLVADQDIAGVTGPAFTCDVANEDEVSALTEWVDSHGTPTAVLHAAGISHPMLAPADLTVQDFRRVVDVNLTGTFLICRAFAARMRQSQGSLISIASMTATNVLRLHGYAPSKAAVLQLIRQLAREWGRDGIRVNAISPGYVATAPLLAAFANGQRSEARLRAASLQDRILDPAEIAETAWFLCSDGARGITGQNIVVDAGFSLNGPWDMASEGQS